MNWQRIGALLRDDGPMGRSLAAVVIVAAWIATWRPQLDPDAWWHLALGDRILADGSIPAVEPFSWLTAGERFVAHSWLWDLLLAGAWRLGGATGTSLLVVPVTALVVWLIWRLIALMTPSLPPLGRALLVLAAVVVTIPVWAPRAQTLDVAFVLAAVYVLARYLRLGSSLGLIALPVIGLLWANLHGSGILALPACVVLAIVALPIGVRWSAWPRRSFLTLAGAGLAGAAATLVNPYGVGLLLYPFDRDVASAFSPAITEWRSPDFGALELLPLRLLLAGLVLIAIWYPARPRDPFILLTTAAWTFAALGSVRFLAIAGPLLVVAMAPAVGVAVERWLGLSLGAGSADRGPLAAPREPEGVGEARAVSASDRSAGPAVLISALAIAGILAAGWLIIDPARQDAAIQRRQPVAAATAVHDAACRGRLLPEYGWAGYIIWSTGQEVGAYGNSAEAAVTEQARLEALQTDPGVWLDDHTVEAVLMPADSPLARWLDEAEGWRLAYRDAQATVHVRADGPGCPLSSPPGS